jgi:hypothetical protein
MTDIVVTAANVVAGAGAIIAEGIAGQAITAGQAAYFDPTVRKWLLADDNSATVAARHATGVALNGAALNQPLQVQTGGDITLGATLTPGLGYFLSDTSGGISLVADISTGEYVCQLGLAKSSTVLTIDVQFPNVAN